MQSTYVSGGNECLTLAAGGEDISDI